MATDNFKLKSPLKVTLNVTNRCNFKCVHCYNGSSSGWEGEELGLAEIKSLLKELKKMEVFLISVNGGEPFLRKDIFEILEEINRLGFVSNINTNASLVTPEIAKRMSELGFKSVDVSLHADNRKNFLRFTGSELFDQTAAGIKNLIKAGVPPSIAFVATSVNISWASDVVKTAANLGVRSMHTIVLVERGRAAGSGLTVKMADLKKAYDKLIKQGEKYKVDLFLECPFNLHEGIASYGMEDIEMDGGCFGGRYLACVQANGDVTPCALFPDYVVGNIKQKKFFDIWNSSEMSALEGGKYELPEGCGRCEILAKCHGGCPTSSYSPEGFVPDHFCVKNKNNN
ncbi:MAG: radical SAM protein [Candidatus Paceibacterota bacterium]|jgi:radical SAM protein with 4Fe4S-binding SPASM domain